MGRLKIKLDAWQKEWPEITPEVRDYLLSDDGIEHIMRQLSDALDNWRWCPVKTCCRARGCQGPDMLCQLGEPRFHAPADEIARANAQLRQIAVRKLDKFGIVPW